jgi:hypothetical protein
MASSHLDSGLEGVLRVIDYVPTQTCGSFRGAKHVTMCMHVSCVQYPLAALSTRRWRSAPFHSRQYHHRYILGVLKTGWVVWRAGNPLSTIDQSQLPAPGICFEGPRLVTGLDAGLGGRSALLHTNANPTFFHRQPFLHRTHKTRSSRLRQSNMVLSAR